MLKSGDLRHRVDIQRRQNVQDDVTGEIVPSWITFLPNEPAQIEPLSVREYLAGKALQSEVVARITIRYQLGLNASMRIRHVTPDGTRIYNPQGFFADRRSGQEYLTIPCSEGVNDG